jgi:hypothetical protein
MPMREGLARVIEWVSGGRRDAGFVSDDAQG